MTYNLIDECWIPVRRSSGRLERIAPWQIAEPDDPPLRIETPRPDFDAALREVLIGLVQSVLTPADEDEWEARYETGVAPATMRKCLETVREAFWLDGDGPRFFQDLTVHEARGVELKPVPGLLIEQGVANEAALFAKAGRIGELSYPAAAMALLTLQSFAPSGGRGQCTSMRGGGPLSVTLTDESLWKTIWCNVLNRLDLATLPGNGSLTRLSDRFPWLVATRTSEKGKSGTFPEHVHPLQHFWGLPRRFRLHFEPELKGCCSILGDQDVPVVRMFASRPDGTSYEGPFLHPLTPYTEQKGEAVPNPRKARSGLSYRDWPLLTIGGQSWIPPRVVEAFQRNRRWRVAQVSRISASGYAMDNMKPLSFLESSVPLLHVSPAVLPILREDASGLVEAADSVRRSLLRQVKSAWSERPGDMPGDVEARTDAAFWSKTEQDFYSVVSAISSLLESGAELQRRAASKTGFLSTLHDAALSIFDELCPIAAELGPDDLARVVRARRDLERFTSAPALLKTVGLAEAHSGVAKPKRRIRRKERMS